MKPSCASPTPKRAIRPARRLAMVLIGVVAWTGVAAIASGASIGASASGSREAVGNTLVLAGDPGNPIANPKTHTLYVPIQSGHVLEVIDTASCIPKPATRCRVVATAAAGKSPLSATVDESTNTIYVVRGTGVTVLNGGRCDAQVHSGCSKPLALIRTGGFPVADALDPRTQTLYVASVKGQVFVIDTAQCNASTTTGCGDPVRTVADKPGPDGIDVDIATDTVYAADAGPNGNGDTVSMINGATCNGSTATGCARTPRTIDVGANPAWDVVDQNTNTVYVANYNEGTVSVINSAKCNATTFSGCRRTPRTVQTGSKVSFLQVDDARHTVFALNQGDATISAIDTRACSAISTSGCSKRPRNEQFVWNPSQGYNPNAFGLIPQTGAVYLANVGGQDLLAAASVARCNTEETSGCRVEAPSVPDDEYLMTLDPATDTIYAGNINLPRIDVINGATCNARRLAGCTPVATIPMSSIEANLGAIDDLTHTLYASNPLSDTIAVINTATCNASDTAGCAQQRVKITVPKYPGPPVLDLATQTLYAAVGASGNRLAVVNVANCNAEVQTGCGETPGTAIVGKGSYSIALSAATDTVYAANLGGQFSGDTVSVVNGATCNANDQAGCAHPAATVKVGLAPFGLTVNDSTHTVYVANNADGNLPGTLSLINDATCNASDTAGCGRHMPTVVVGRSPRLIAINPTTDTIYVTDHSSAAVSILNGASCNAQDTSGCSTPVPEQPIGSAPSGILVDPATDSVYAANLLGLGSLSIFTG